MKVGLLTYNLPHHKTQKVREPSQAVSESHTVKFFFLLGRFQVDGVSSEFDIMII